ncbi:MAG: nucleotide exchange factor GrpE [Thermodesulfobacteriota bacterium]
MVEEERTEELAPEAAAVQAVEEAPTEESAARIQALEHQLAEEKDRLLRMAAEFENSKKRLAREAALRQDYAEESFMREILPAIDNLERALAQGQEGGAQALLDGVELTRQGLMATLERLGLSAIVSLGQPFDPHRHEAMTVEATDELPPSHVLREFQKGYQFKERVIRPARVVVSKKGC